MSSDVLLGAILGTLVTLCLMVGYAAKYYGRLGVAVGIIWLLGGLWLSGILRGAS